MNEESKQNEDLNIGQQFLNLWSGADFLLHWLIAIPWIIQMWIYQYQKARGENKSFFPQLPKSILVYDTDCKAQDVLDRYHIHNMHFGNSFESGNNQTEMEHAILLPASQYDYADAVLTQHGYAVLSEAGTKRGYTMRPPRDYGNRQPQRRQTQQSAKLGKTYS